MFQAFVPHGDVFPGIFHQGLFFLQGSSLQCTVFLTQRVDDVQLAADEALRNRTLDVITRMDSLEEFVQKGFKVSFVESLGRSGILHIGLCLLQGAVNGLAVVETFGKLYDFGTYKDVGTADRLLQLDTFERSASAQCHIRLSAGKHPTGKVDDYTAERQSLAFVYRNGPCQSDGKLAESAQLLFFYLFLLLVVAIADVAPHLLLDVAFRTVVRYDVQRTFQRIKAAHHTDCSVHPAAVVVVFDEDDLCSGLQYQFLRSRQTAFRKFACYLSIEGHRFTGQFGQLTVVDVVHVVAACGQGNVHVGFRLDNRRTVSGVQQLQVSSSGRIASYVVQYPDKLRVILPVYLLQFDGHQFYLAEYPCRKEIRSRVEAVQYFPLIPLDDRLQLKDIAHQQHLFTAEGFAQVVTVNPQYPVHRINDVGPHHRNLVNNDQFQLLKQFAMRLGILEKFVNTAFLQTQVRIIGQQRMKRQLEEAVQRAASGIDGCYPCRSQHHMFLAYIVADVAQEG